LPGLKAIFRARAGFGASSGGGDQGSRRGRTDGVPDRREDRLGRRRPRPGILTGEPVDGGETELNPAEVSRPTRLAGAFECLLEMAPGVRQVASRQGKTGAVRQRRADVPQVRTPSGRCQEAVF